LGLAFVLTAFSVAFATLDAADPRATTPVQWVPLTFAVLVYSGLGALLAARRPENPVGWIILGAGVLLSAAAFADHYTTYGLDGKHALPALDQTNWVGGWIWIAALAPLGIFLPLLFPHGRLPSPGWRPAARLAIAVLVLGVCAKALDPTSTSHQRAWRPVDLSGAKGVVHAVEVLTFVPAIAIAIAAVISLGRRLRRARGEERQQLKWFTFAIAVLVPGVIFSNGAVGQALVTAGVLAVPAAVTIAILRYRLYEIDVVINRTLVYGGLTALLAGTYVGSVLLLQLALRPLTAKSDLAIAGSTLAVAALFRPARSRIQALVDRRFFRRKYDAAQTLEAFSARLREEVDLDSLAGELREVVRATMQPAHVSLWLRTPEARG
jgi:hypothetical protein